VGPRRAKPPFPINLIFNIRAFYLAFIIVMIGGLAAGTLGYTGSGGGRRQAEQIERTTTPEPTGTPVNFPQFEKPDQVIDPSKQYFAVLKTDQGDIRIELFAKDAPQAVNSFVFLAQQGFYNGLEFFFVRQGFVAQAGDPSCDAAGRNACTGTGGPGYTLPVEANSHSHVQGAVVLPAIVEEEKVHGSQFRILLADDQRLDGKETVFGQVVAGKELLGALPERLPCFGQEPSAAYPCQLEPPAPLVIRDVVIEAT